MKKILYVYVVSGFLFYLGTSWSGLGHSKMSVATHVADLNKNLLAAAYRGDIQAIRNALDAGADVNAQDDYGRTALMGAVGAEDRANIIPLLLEAGADVNAKSNNGYTVLIYAAIRGHAEIVPLLLEAGVDVNAKSKDGSTALIYAAERGYVDVVRFLLARGADSNARNNNGDAALMGAALGNRAAPGVYVDIVRLLLDAGANVNAKTKRGMTVLMCAAVGRNTDIVPLLLEREADVNAQNNEGRTALDLARNEQVKKVLRDFIDKLNKEFLESARKLKNAQLEKALKFGADINAKDERGNTALHLLAGVSKEEKIDFKPALAALMTGELLRRKGVLMLRNKDGETPVDIAMTLPDSPIMKMYKKSERPDVKRALRDARIRHEDEEKQLRKAAKEVGPQEGEDMTHVIAREFAEKHGGRLPLEN